MAFRVNRNIISQRFLCYKSGPLYASANQKTPTALDYIYRRTEVYSPEVAPLIEQKGKTYDKKPFKIKLEAHKPYLWCMCGLSHHQVRHCATAADKKGEIFDTKPVKFTLEAGKQYSWCACGQSKKQPLCDGMHKVMKTDFLPVRFKVEEAVDVWLCNCKQTLKRPYCDGTHKKPEIQELKR